MQYQQYVYYLCEQGPEHRKSDRHKMTQRLVTYELFIQLGQGKNAI